LVSANGPSVVRVLPSRVRSVVAVRTGCSASPATKWPLALMLWVNVMYSDSIELAWSCGMSFQIFSSS
jgi:hypothetical protein